ncbi:hypothetical protein Pla163_25760 [Planctomycetes bacterium Pla163]|uniref:DUF1294 domain-containing protein n=1 Tax=Rohdeia mirabilis TaxID=2528008 RepID=A0A518D1U6_9BACT|nr:hypothetical protein Pla163_25760 [Planctomycetes bacterium Pla163]
MNWPSWTPLAVVGGFCAVNLWAFAQVWWDKRAARLQQRRIPEKRLIAPVLVAGPFGLLLGMRRFRHKTVKRSFQAQVAVATVLWVAWVAGLCWMLLREGAA